MKLNLACGRSVKKGYINVDIMERENRLDFIMDLTKPFPWANGSCEYIYVEHFIEHLNWLEGQNFLIKCYRVLEAKGIIRLVIPDFKKIFRCYLNRDYAFFEPFRKNLNEVDYQYYYEVYNNPVKFKNISPKWHTSPHIKDRKKLELRKRKFEYLIDFVHYLTHQFGEHCNLFDFESLSGLLMSIGFTYIKKTEIKDIDSHEPTRIDSSLYVEATK